MRKRISLALAVGITATIAGSSAAVDTVEGTILAAAQVPKYVPEILRQEWYQRPHLPSGWNSATPFGGAMTLSGSGTLEISSFKLKCEIPGKSGRQTVLSGTDSIGGGLYLKDPWFGGNDFNEPVKMTRTPDKTVIFNIPPNRVLHWWAGRANLPAGTKNCATRAVVRGTGNVLVGVGADWWKSPTAQWSGLNGNNREIGVGNWYDLRKPGWQIVRMEPKK